MASYKKDNYLIIIGGAEDKKYNKSILKKVCEFLDKEKDLFLIAAIASNIPQEMEEIYIEVLSEIGIKNMKTLKVRERKESYEDKNIELVKSAKILFFTGGDQLRITSLIGGTPLDYAIKETIDNGCVYVGTSAGASVSSETMIVSGEGEESPKKCGLSMAPGLGLIKDVIIDQHFDQRGRIGRLLIGVAHNPHNLGIGIDEDTAIIIKNNEFFNVIGSGAVYVVDGKEVTDTNVSESSQNEVMSMFNIKLHVLKEGNVYDLAKRKPCQEKK